MPCIPFDNGKGGRGFICTTRQRSPRCKCGSGQTANLRCDWKVKGKTSGTCDKVLCPSCTHAPARGKDLCPVHANQWNVLQAAKREARA